MDVPFFGVPLTNLQGSNCFSSSPPPAEWHALLSVVDPEVPKHVPLSEEEKQQLLNRPDGVGLRAGETWSRVALGKPKGGG